MRIFIIGLTSTKVGAMEFHNLGNYTIMEPFIVLLKEAFPGSDIVTSIQMSDKFCRKHNISCRREERFWTYGKKTGMVTLADIFKAAIWFFFMRVFHNDLKGVIGSSDLLEEMYKADLVIDFSGDIFGDNANYRRFMEGCAEMIMAKMLGKPVAMLAGSPGPFKAIWRKALAKFVLNRVDLITNREPLSTDLLKKIGIKEDMIRTTACPSFLFEPGAGDGIQSILEEEGIAAKGRDKPLFGLIISGWNMPEPPFNKLPREEHELRPFVQLIDHLVKRMGSRVLIMTHQNATNEKGELAPGNDHAIIAQLISMLPPDKYGNDVFTLKGLYNAAESKAIIGCLDMLISGRIHAAISGISQCVPVVIVDYGHEPKAHKIKGFAKLTGMEQYICDPSSAEDMIRKASLAWENRAKTREDLCSGLEDIKNMARYNYELLKDLVCKQNG